jgi:hypothetical protein
MTIIRCAAMAAAALSLCACGGGIEDDDNGSQPTLVCATTCIDSSTVATAQIRHSYALVSDGQQLQAQAGFSTGSDPRFNVALEGGDQLLLATPQGTQDFHIPASGFATIFVDAFTQLIAGAKPYLSEVTPVPAGSAAYEFRFVRNGAVMAAPVTLPAPFVITQPVANAVLEVSAPTLVVQVSTPGTYSFSGDFSCTDVNGNTATSDTVMNVLGAPQNVNGGVAYTLDLASTINGLQFTSTYPRGSISSCSVTLHAQSQIDGTPSAAFASGSRVFAQQIRSTGFKLAPLH